MRCPACGFIDEVSVDQYNARLRADRLEAQAKEHARRNEWAEAVACLEQAEKEWETWYGRRHEES